MKITLFCVALLFIQCNTSETDGTSNPQTASETGSTSKPQTDAMTGGLIAQNNQVTRANAERLTVGMTPSQVKSIMGTPRTETKGYITYILLSGTTRSVVPNSVLTLTFCNGNKSVSVYTSFNTSDRLDTVGVSQTTIGVANFCIYPPSR